MSVYSISGFVAGPVNPLPTSRCDATLRRSSSVSTIESTDCVAGQVPETLTITAGFIPLGPIRTMPLEAIQHPGLVNLTKQPHWAKVPSSHVVDPKVLFIGYDHECAAKVSSLTYAVPAGRQFSPAVTTPLSQPKCRRWTSSAKAPMPSSTKQVQSLPFASEKSVGSLNCAVFGSSPSFLQDSMSQQESGNLLPSSLSSQVDWHSGWNTSISEVSMMSVYSISGFVAGPVNPFPTSRCDATLRRSSSVSTREFTDCVAGQVPETLTITAGFIPLGPIRTMPL